MHLFATVLILISTQLVAADRAKVYTVFGKMYTVLDSADNYSETGIASWYGEQFHGNPTSSGTIYDMHKISAAHKTLPLGSWVKVTNLETQKQLMLEVNDRGPFVKDRLIDLSLAAAKELDIIKAGTAKVRVESIRAPKNLARETTPHLFQIGAFRNIENLKHLKQSMLSDSSLKNVTFKIEKNNDLYRLFASVPSNNLNEIKAWGIKNHTKPIEVKTGV